MTEYVLFQFHKESPEVPGAWTEWTRMPARSAQSAIRQMLERSPESQTGQFVAVPARSWRPVTVKVETKTALKFT